MFVFLIKCLDFKMFSVKKSDEKILIIKMLEV
jgi:hypothetical protein